MGRLLRQQRSTGRMERGKNQEVAEVVEIYQQNSTSNMTPRLLPLLYTPVEFYQQHFRTTSRNLLVLTLPQQKQGNPLYQQKSTGFELPPIKMGKALILVDFYWYNAPPGFPFIAGRLSSNFVRTTKWWPYTRVAVHQTEATFLSERVARRAIRSLMTTYISLNVSIGCYNYTAAQVHQPIILHIATNNFP